MRLSDHRPDLTCRQLSPPSGLIQAPVPTVPTQIVKLSAMAQPPPAGDHDPVSHPVWEMSMTTPVGAGPFHLEVAMAAGRHFHIEPVLRGELSALGALQPLRGFVEILDFDAEVMDAAEIGTVSTDIGVLLGLKIEDGDIDIAIRQKDRAVWAAADLLQSECLFVEGGGLTRILRGQRDVLDSGHRFRPSG